MSHKVEFTQEHRDWLRDNYPLLSNKQCRKYLGCGFDRLKVLVEELGMEWKTYTPAAKIRMERHHDREANGGYCIDCKRYREGGICGKNGKEIGALWQKKCFK